MTTTVATPADWIESRIVLGLLDSTLDESVSQFRQNPHTWYTLIQEQKGLPAAESAFEEWIEGLKVFSSAVRNIADGLLALALVELEESPFRITTNDQMPRYPSIAHKSAVTDMLVFRNISAPGCGCVQPRGTEEFGPGGTFGLSRIVLETGQPHSRFHGQATLGLVTTRMEKMESADPRDVGFSVLSVNSAGICSGECFKTALTPATFMQYALGEIDAHSAMTSGAITLMGPIASVFESIFDMPDAQNNFAGVILRLTEYLGELAEALSGAHSH